MSNRTCKGCGKELIGKERVYCKNCSLENKDKVKRVLGVAGGIAGIGTLIFLGRDKIGDILKEFSKTTKL